MTLVERIDQLVEHHGSLRAVARVTEIEVGYLSRLRAGEKVNPSKDTLRRLGLRRIVTYESLLAVAARQPAAPEPSEADLPPLPRAAVDEHNLQGGRLLYTAEQMRAYALRAAVAARGSK